MSFEAVVAVCDECHAVRPTRDEGELPDGWLALLEEHAHSTDPLLVFDSWACVRAYILRKVPLSRTDGTTALVS